MLLDAKQKTYQQYFKLGNDANSNGNIEQAKQYYRKAAAVAKELAMESIMAETKQYYALSYKQLMQWCEEANNNTVVASKQSTRSGEGGSGKLKWFSTDVPNITLADVAGLTEEKKEIEINVFAPINNPEVCSLYGKKEHGANILLYGPPGTGKTLIAEAIAGELKCPVAVVHSKDILASLVGDAEKNIAEVFEEAEQFDKCIIFFDEIDALCAERDSDESRYTKGVMTTMLSKMDGFAKRGKNSDKLQIVIAATNRPWVLDTAIMRGGRFGTKIYVGLPDADARKAIVTKCLANVPKQDDVTFEWLVQKLEGYAGADICEICDKIRNRPLGRAIEAVREKRSYENERITRQDCEDVIAKYINSNTKESLKVYEIYKNNK